MAESWPVLSFLYLVTSLLHLAVANMWGGTGNVLKIEFEFEKSKLL